MQETITLFILVAGAILAALAATTVMAGTVQLTSRRSHGYLHLIFYAMVVMVALSTVNSELANQRTPFSSAKTLM